jgi:hypothetical protein
MIGRLVTASLLITFTVLTVFGQEPEKKPQEQDSAIDRGKVVNVPREILLPLAIHQPDCPLKLEFAGLHAPLDGGGIELYRFRNQGNKTIEGFKIAWLFPGGTGGSIEGNERIFPGESFGHRDDYRHPLYAEMIPFTDELKKKLKLDGGMRGIIYYMVVNLKFSDETVFNDEPAYKALHAYLEKIDPDK